MWTNATNGTASTHLSSPDIALLSPYPTAWYPEYPSVECLPTPCAPCYTSITTILRSFPYPIVQEPLTVSVIPYVAVVANGSRLTSFVTSTQFESLGSNTTDIAIQLYETFTWMERDVTMTYPTTYIDLWGFGANVRSATSAEPSQTVSPTCANMDMLSYVALPSPISTIWPLPTPDASNSSGPAATLPSDMLSYLDGQSIIKDIFQGIPISSCSAVYQIQSAPCYDLFTFTTSRCTTLHKTVAASAVNLTQCVTTTDVVSRPRFSHSEGDRGGVGGVGRISAQLLTYITGEPVYGPTPDAQTTVAPTDLPLSEARIAAIPASTRDANNRMPVETQGASAANGDMQAARMSDNGNRGSSSVRGHVLVISGSQITQGAPRTTGTEHYYGSPTTPTTSPQLEHVDPSKLVLAIQEVASELRASHRRPQEIESRPASIASSNLQLTTLENTMKDDGKDDPSPTATQDVEDVEDGMLPLSNSVSTTSKPSPEGDHVISMYLKSAMAADSVQKSPGMRQLFPTTHVPISATIQPETLAPGGVLDFGNSHLSVLPDASGMALGNGSTLRLKDGETAEVELPDGRTLQFSRSGTVYLVETRTADMTPQLTETISNGPSEPARTTGQIADEDGSLLRSTAEASVDVATDGPAKGTTAAGDASLSLGVSEASIGVATDRSSKGTAAEMSTGGALVCLSDARNLVMGMLVALVC